MNKQGIEVHELQRPRPNRRTAKRRLEDIQPMTRSDRMWIIGTFAGTVAFWCVVAWVFS